MKRMECLNALFRLGTLVVVLLTGNGVQADEITGYVYDAKSGETVIGAYVWEEPRGERNNVVVTGVDGAFRLQVDRFPATLGVSCMGYKTRSLRVEGARKPLVIHLEEDVSTFDEVVVVGYGTQRRTQLTGAVSTVGRDILENYQAPTVEGVLSGTVPGVSVVESGQPGSSSSIRIRGGNSVNASNDPLYVIDGFIYYKEASGQSTGVSGLEGGISPLALINPSDIESIEVLKDVSATAIYGSRGANGVVIVTTKKGRRGENTVKYDFQFTMGRSAKTLDLLNASEFARLQKDYFYNKGGYTDAEIAALGEGTDWQDAVLQTALTHSHSVTVSGGDDKTRYVVGGNYVHQDGLIIHSGFQRTALRVNIERKVFDPLTVGITSTLSRNKQSGLTTTTGKSYNSSPYSAGITSSLTYALFMPPVIPIYTATGDYNYTNPYEYAYFAIGDHAANPVSDLKNSTAESLDDAFLANVYAHYTFAGHFALKGSLGLNIDNISQSLFAPSYTAIGLQEEGIGSVGKRRNEVWQTEWLLTYTRNIADRHEIDAFVGYTFQQNSHTLLTATSTHFSNETLGANNLAGGAQYYAPVTKAGESTLHSVIARLNYTLHNRYNATVTFRGDRSSRFARSHEWGYFPSVGLSWNIDKERFLKQVGWIETLKLRTSFGVVGNQEIGDYEYAETYTAGNYGGTVVYTKSNNTNADLKWETTASYNVGFDLGLWKGRLTLTGDVYYKKTSDLLLVVPTDPATGTTNQLKNIGNVRNKGFELGLVYRPLQTAKAHATFSANVAYNVNEITDMGSSRTYFQGSNQILQVGEALGSFYGLLFDGVVQLTDDPASLPTQNGAVPQPGDAKFVDVNGDGKIDQNDRTVLGHTQPTVTFGFSGSWGYKRWDAFVLFSGAAGNSVYNSLRRTLEHPTDAYNVSRVLLGAWTPENPSNTIPRISDTRPFSSIDSRYVEDASYLRLKTLTVGYTFSVAPLKARLRLSLSATNLFTLTGYKGYDPEVGGGVDNGNYPMARSVAFGLGLTF